MTSPSSPPHHPWAVEEAREVLAFPSQSDGERIAAARRVLERDQEYRLSCITQRQVEIGSPGQPIQFRRLDAWETYLLEDR